MAHRMPRARIPGRRAGACDANLAHARLGIPRLWLGMTVGRSAEAAILSHLAHVHHAPNSHYSSTKLTFVISTDGRNPVAVSAVARASRDSRGPSTGFLARE